MNRGIAHELMMRLVDNEWFTVAGGLAQTVVHVDTLIDPLDESKTTRVEKRLPATCDAINRMECSEVNGLTLLIPDSRYRGMFYFEDLGVQVLKSGTAYTDFRSRLRLVVWLNGKFAGMDCHSLSGVMAAEVIQKLTSGFVNAGNFLKMLTRVESEVVTGAQVFSRYSYDEAVMQYLMQPYQYFALDLATTFSVRYGCLENIPVTEPVC